jgi:hypothetical protein
MIATPKIEGMTDVVIEIGEVALEASRCELEIAHCAKMILTTVHRGSIEIAIHIADTIAL